MRKPVTNIGLRDYIRSISPPWLTYGTYPNQTGTSGPLMYDFGLLGDFNLEKLNQAIYARMPGRGTPTINPILGNDRVLTQAPAEPAQSFTKRLTGAFDAWSTAGNDQAVLRQVLTYFTPYTPLTRIVSNTGVWNFYDPNDGANFQTSPPVHYQFNSWDWDDTENPLTLEPAWWRVWLLVFPGLILGGRITGASGSPIEITTAHPESLETGDQVCITSLGGNIAANGYFTITAADSTHFKLDGTTSSGPYTTGGFFYLVPETALETAGEAIVGPGIVCGALNPSTGLPYVCGEVSQFSVGFNVPSSWFQPIVVLINQWKSAQSWFRYLVFCFDSSVFSPYTTPGTEPAGGTNGPGNWGSPTTIVNGVAVPTRNPHARYVGGVS